MYQYQVQWQNVILGHYVQMLPFLPMPSGVSKMPMSGGVYGRPKGVWMVSKGVWQMSGGMDAI